MFPIIIPRAKGHYVLVLQTVAKQTIGIGRLGTFQFQPGYYCYVGSALGSAGLAGRVGRHLAGKGKPRWHIDYLRRNADPFQVWLVRSEMKLECLLAKKLGQLRGSFVPVAGFGSSDCTCHSHLYYFFYAPPFEEFSNSLQSVRWPDAKPEKVDLPSF
jgi:Uri superfamily endonuclease